MTGSEVLSQARPRARFLALHLPQFHPIPENDDWWGKGFTEWTNVARARRRYPGHYQPHVPADLGFYDLRLPEALAAQAALARAHGVEGFVFWHYWFGNGNVLLDQPIQQWIQSGSPDFGFALAWANQSWTGHWHGGPKRVLMEQTYPGLEDEKRHFEYLLPAFSDPRYLKVDGRPIFYIFRGESLPNPAGFVDTWRSMAEQAGLPGLYLVAELNDPLGRSTFSDPWAAGFDASVDLRLPADRSRRATIAMKVMRKLGLPEIYPYASEPLLRNPFDPTRPTHPSVVPGWDNTPRAGRNGLVLHGSTPALFRRHVDAAVAHVQPAAPDRRIVFVKSWNEWAEGNHLEPDHRHGLSYLEALGSRSLVADECGP
jgi:hypothetical protein